MVKLTVLYTKPEDPQRFREYYEGTHLPLAARLPGMLARRHSFAIGSPGGEPPYFCVFEAEFSDHAALEAAMGSPEGQAVAADVPNYATSEVVMMVAEFAD